MSVAQSEFSAPPNDTESRGSMAPLLPGSFPQSTDSSKSSSQDPEPMAAPESAPDATTGNEKSSKRPFWKLGKKTDEGKAKDKVNNTTLSKSKPPPPHIAPIAALQPASPLRSPEPGCGSVSSQRGQSYGSPGSPGHAVYSSSPRLHSPASSQIFERNVQEDVMPPHASPQIPSHIITENHIPPALDASSAAITNEQLDPDSVEIVTHAMHQPAAIPAGASLEASTTSLHEDYGTHRPEVAGDDTASNYGTLDAADVRRLSFISFADVVHAEHAEHIDPGSADHHTGRNSVHLGGLSGTIPTLAAPPRSPSPIHSPLSSPGHGTSPPSSVSPSFKGIEPSPPRGHRGSGGSMAPPPLSPPLSGGGDLNIETMRQALRKTGSGDLSGVRSQPLSAVGNDDGTYVDRPFK
jgi:hypothetical protein